MSGVHKILDLKIETGQLFGSAPTCEICKCLTKDGIIYHQPNKENSCKTKKTLICPKCFASQDNGWLMEKHPSCEICNEKYCPIGASKCDICQKYTHKLAEHKNPSKCVDCPRKIKTCCACNTSAILQNQQLIKCSKCLAPLCKDHYFIDFHSFYCEGCHPATTINFR